MRTIDTNTHLTFLQGVADMLGYALEVKSEEGDNYACVYMNAPDKTQPNLSVDYHEKAKKFEFRTLLPIDRWGYPQRAGYGTSATGTCNVSASNNSAKAAGYVKRMIADHAESHAAHLRTIKNAEDYYDRQMDNAERLSSMLDGVVEHSVHGLGAKPNHNGHVDVFLTLSSSQRVTVTGRGASIDLIALDPYRAAKVIHALTQK